MSSEKIDKKLTSMSREINKAANGGLSAKSLAGKTYRSITRIPILGYAIRLIGLLIMLPHNRNTADTFTQITTKRLNDIERRLAASEKRLDNLDKKILDD